MAKKYRKLVRDRIPAIIEAGGKACVWEVLPQEEYLRALDTKQIGRASCRERV